MTRPSLSRAAQYTVDPVGQARAALHRGPIIPAGAHYRFRGHKFNRATVNTLVEAGEAHRRADGQIVACAAERSEGPARASSHHRAALPTVMSGDLCPRCRIRYLPIAGDCICRARP